MKKVLLLVAIIILVIFGFFFLTDIKEEKPLKDGELLKEESLKMEILSVKQTDDFFHIDVEYPQIESIKNGFNKMIRDLMEAEIENFKKVSLENFESRIETTPEGQPKPEKPDSPFDFLASWKPVQINSRYVSFVINIYYFSGGAHGNEKIYTFNYDLNKEKEIFIEDFLSQSQDGLEKISKISRDKISNQLELAGWQKDGAIGSMIEEGTKPIVENFQSFNFTKDSLIVYFQKYQVVPGAAGPISVVITKEELEDNSINSMYIE